ncbi:hypothetical protein [Haloarchaeobius baliensis]|uniref:hypothetical protein n=1 Tax=Haloarchaeobius baliensis TaxID=1670458 RepID=UPI003F882F4A
MKEIEEMSNDELVEEYRETVEFRAIESEHGQVTPHEIDYRKALEQEIVDRMR